MSWFVRNLRDMQWWTRPGRGSLTAFVGDDEQVCVNLFVLGPGESMSMYHWEADQEGFLVLAGEAVLIVEDEEHPLRQWDYFHKPAGVSHTIIGAGDGPSAILALGAREHQHGPDWGGYTVDEAALRHDAGVEEETTEPKQAYARFTKRKPTRYREGWLPK